MNCTMMHGSTNIKSTYCVPITTECLT